MSVSCVSVAAVSSSMVRAWASVESNSVFVVSSSVVYASVLAHVSAWPTSWVNASLGVFSAGGVVSPGSGVVVSASAMVGVAVSAAASVRPMILVDVVFTFVS